MPVIFAALAVRVVQYDGTNSAEMIAAMDDSYAELVTTLISEAAGVLTLYTVFNGGSLQGGGEFDLVLQVGDWLRPDGPEVIPAATFAEQWIAKP
jgi:hypothetical protein